MAGFVRLSGLTGVLLVLSTTWMTSSAESPWSDWFNSDNPSFGGGVDDETLDRISRVFPAMPCRPLEVTSVQCRTKGDPHPSHWFRDQPLWARNALHVPCNRTGVVCRNRDQQPLLHRLPCKDYEIRVRCPERHGNATGGGAGHAEHDDESFNKLGSNGGFIAMAAGGSVVLPLVCVLVLQLRKSKREERRRLQQTQRAAEDQARAEEEARLADSPPAYDDLFGVVPAAESVSVISTSSLDSGVGGEGDPQRRGSSEPLMVVGGRRAAGASVSSSSSSSSSASSGLGSPSSSSLSSSTSSSSREVAETGGAAGSPPPPQFAIVVDNVMSASRLSVHHPRTNNHNNNNHNNNNNNNNNINRNNINNNNNSGLLTSSSSSSSSSSPDDNRRPSTSSSASSTFSSASHSSSDALLPAGRRRSSNISHVIHHDPPPAYDWPGHGAAGHITVVLPAGSDVENAVDIHEPPPSHFSSSSSSSSSGGRVVTTTSQPRRFLGMHLSIFDLMAVIYPDPDPVPTPPPSYDDALKILGVPPAGRAVSAPTEVHIT